jgi:hypothetical protein
MPNEQTVNWEAILNSMRSVRIRGVEPRLESTFYELFDDILRFSLPKWMQ